MDTQPAWLVTFPAVVRLDNGEGAEESHLLMPSGIVTSALCKVYKKN